MNLQVKNVSKSYNNINVIKNISIDLKTNQIISIIGSSGIGKTTLFNIISGIELPDAGNVFLNGEDITGITGKVGYMFQKDLLLYNKSILDNVILPLRIKGYSKSDAKKVAVPYFKQFGLNGCENKYPKEVSGGMIQRTALLRTYLFSKSILLLDEPFSNLDSISKLSMYEWYLDVSRKNIISSIIITHDIEEAIFLSDVIYIISGKPGQIVKRIDLPLINKTEQFILNNDLIEIKREILSIIKNDNNIYVELN